MPIIVDLGGTPGTGLDLTAIWLNVASDPSNARGFVKVGGPLSANTMARGEIRQLANRRRLIRQASVTGGAIDLAESMSLSFPHCDRDQVAWLRSKTGTMLCFRDHVGTKFYGAFLEAPREVQPQFRDWMEVKLSISQVTYSEVV